MHNRRDAAMFDLYSINLVSGEEMLLYENNENIINLLIDDNGRVQARIKQTEDARLVQIPSQTKEWKTLLSASKFDSIHPLNSSLDGSSLYLLSNVGRERQVLIELNLISGAQKVLAEHDRVDIHAGLISPARRLPQLAYAAPDYPTLIYLDDKLQHRLRSFLSDTADGLSISSLDRVERYAVISSWDHSGRAE